MTITTPGAKPINQPAGVSTLGALRALAPGRPLTFAEALSVAERQATRLVQCLGVGTEGIGEHHIAAMTRIRVCRADLPVSGTSHWSGTEWIITLARGDSLARQRFTLLHEYKHIVDHGRQAHLYRGDRYRTAEIQAELAADYFAGCALVSKRQLKLAWGNGLQRTEDLADHFGVSPAAVQVRLAQTGLNRVSDEHGYQGRCGRRPTRHIATPIRPTARNHR